MDYRIFSISTGEDENSAEAHVLARAYRAVWRATHGSEPAGAHQIAPLDLFIQFGGWAPAWTDISHECSASIATDTNIASELMGGRDDH